MDKKIEDNELKDVSGGNDDVQEDPAPRFQPKPPGGVPEGPGGGGGGADLPEGDGGGGGNEDLQI